MCDYSLTNLKSRPAVVGDKLVTTNFSTGTCGLASIKDKKTPVCVLPGTELAFDNKLNWNGTWSGYGPKPGCAAVFETAIFRQSNKDQPRMHHDELEFPDGQKCLLHFMPTGVRLTVLQLPAAPRNKAEAEEQRRVEVVG